MPSVLSRLLLAPDRLFSVPGSPAVPIVEPCSVISHPWCQTCLEANKTVIRTVLYKCFRTYFTLYLVSGLIRLKKWPYWRQNFWKDVFRSTFMLMSNGCAVFCLNCCSRNLFGMMTPTLLRLVILMGSSMAIFFERQSRRYILAFFMGSNAVECVYNRMVESKQIRSIKHFDTLMFVAASAIMGCFFKSEDDEMKRVSSDIVKPLSVIFGNYESETSTEIPTDSTGISESFSPRTSLTRRSDVLDSFFKTEIMRKLNIRITRFFTSKCAHRSKICLHPQPCLQYITYGALRGLSLGYSASFAFNILRNLSKITQPRKFISRVFDKYSVQTAVFLSLFVSTFRASACILRAFQKRNSAFVGAIAGSVSGFSFVFLRSYIISLYVFLKSAEVLIKYAIRDTWIDRFPYKSEIIYALSVVETIFAILIWPQNVRPQYRDFVNDVSGDKFKHVNRRLAAAHWNLDVKHVPNYPPPDRELQLAYEEIARMQRLKLHK
ncbi:transmembrane protein 135-like [Symsagittifera roscoffensis]|uniref:transmembrane protein 135-like n=1 Tax=Symsagittifera roscoffensis TaxID=84072 RepID=UPI00307C706C